MALKQLFLSNYLPESLLNDTVQKQKSKLLAQ